MKQKNGSSEAASTVLGLIAYFMTDNFIFALCLAVGLEIVALIIKGISEASETAVVTENFPKALEGISNSNFNFVLVGKGKHSLAIDSENKKICIASKERSQNIIYMTVIPYNDLMSADITRDAHSVISTSRGSQLGGVAVGGLLLGGVGAIVGGVTAEKKQTEVLNSIKMKLVINDIYNPVYEIELSDMNQANLWISRLDIILNKETSQPFERFNTQYYITKEKPTPKQTKQIT